MQKKCGKKKKGVVMAISSHKCGFKSRGLLVFLATHFTLGFDSDSTNDRTSSYQPVPENRYVTAIPSNRFLINTL